MKFDVSKVSGIGEYAESEKTLGSGDDAEKVMIYYAGKGFLQPFLGHTQGRVASLAASGAPERMVPEKVVSKPFLVIRKNTIEVRTDSKLRDLLREKYETVMESRYFGKGGVEIVNSGQLSEDELHDLVRLSYNLSA